MSDGALQILLTGIPILFGSSAVAWIIRRALRITPEQASLLDLNRLQADYINTLRGQLSDAGVTPDPWPEGLTSR